MSSISIHFPNLDSTVHGPVRLGILTALQAEGTLDFTTLKKWLGVADGAIGNHLRKLEEVGYISCKKRFVGRRPKSDYTLSKSGREALFSYLQQMQRLIEELQNSSTRNGNSNGKRNPA